MANASSNLSTRWSNGNPNARNSTSFHPAPSPRINRPPLISSTVAAFFASIAGLWNDALATSGPSSTRSVTAARAARADHASQGPRGDIPGSRYRRWSPTHTESNPTSSAARAMSRSSGHRTSRSTSGSWTPTRRGRPLFAVPMTAIIPRGKTLPLGARRCHNRPAHGPSTGSDRARAPTGRDRGAPSPRRGARLLR